MAVFSPGSKATLNEIKADVEKLRENVERLKPNGTLFSPQQVVVVLI
jgi:hypothetical protein